MLLEIILLSILLRTSLQSGCTIDIASVEKYNEPLILDDNFNFFNSTNKEFSQNALIADNSNILISCTSKNLTSRYDDLLSNLNTIKGVCNNQSEIEILGQIIKLEDLHCSDKSLDVAELTTTRCYENAQIVKIGFWIEESNKFVNQYLVCFDTVSRNILYSYHKISKYFGYGTMPESRNYLDDSEIYDLPVLLSSRYIGEILQRQINTLLGLPSNSTKYINRNETDDYYLYATQLSNYLNFFWKPQKLSTFHYINTVPSWLNDFNNPDNNWKQLHMDLFKLTFETSHDLEIYTGTYGVATLPHEQTGEDIELYLYSNDLDGIQAVPIPKLLWKLIYEPASKAAVVLITVNNPFRVLEVDKICRNVAESLKFLSWDPDNLTLGVSYACAYDEFKEVVKHAPDIYVERVFNRGEVYLGFTGLFWGVFSAFVVIVCR